MKRDDLIFEIIEKEHQRQLKGIEPDRIREFRE